MPAFVGAWKPVELQIAKQAIAPLPSAWVNTVQYIARAPVMVDAAPGAPGHSKYVPRLGAIVVYDKGVYDRGQLDSEQLRRSIFHEMAHAILRNDPSILDRWQEETQGDGFVDEYAKTSPTEDFCDTFSEFLIFPERSQKAVPRKWRFLYNLMQSHQEKTAMRTHGFNDELQKLAMSPGAMSGIKNMISGALGSRALRTGAMLGAGGLAGGALGMSSGQKKGYAMGTGDVGQVAEQAFQVGQQEGAQAGYQFAIEQMQDAMGQGESYGTGYGMGKKAGLPSALRKMLKQGKLPKDSDALARVLAHKHGREMAKIERVAPGIGRATRDIAKSRLLSDLNPTAGGVDPIALRMAMAARAASKAPTGPRNIMDAIRIQKALRTISPVA